MGFIYKIVNDINDMVYVGQTIKTLNKRWQQHKNNYTKPYFSQLSLYIAFNKIGIEHFHLEQIEEIDNSLLDEREMYWIKQLNSYNHGYNSTLGGHTVTLYEFDEDKIVQEYLELKSSRKVAKRYNVDHSVITKILHKNKVYLFPKGETTRKEIVACYKNIEMRFSSQVKCAEYLVNNNLVQSKSVYTVKGYIGLIANNQKEDYYGWKFYRE